MTNRTIHPVGHCGTWTIKARCGTSVALRAGETAMDRIVKLGRIRPHWNLHSITAASEIPTTVAVHAFFVSYAFEKETATNFVWAMTVNTGGDFVGLFFP